MTGKIIKGIAGFYYVNDGRNHVYQCKAKGVFRSRKIKPLVGDNVEFSVLDEEEKEGNIDAILPRSNVLIRPAVANVDQALVVFAITHPEPNLNLLDRFLVMMGIQGVPVTICFNKVDLWEAGLVDKYRAIYERAGYEVHFVSTYDDTGLEEMRKILRGKTSVLAGPSGVGKSSLTNRIQPQAAMGPGDIRRTRGRGRHTTRQADGRAVDAAADRVDPPGFSSMFIDFLEPGELKHYFPEFGPYEDECKFLGCVHVGERVCGVKEALKRGELSRGRYDNYILMYEELKNKRRY